MVKERKIQMGASNLSARDGSIERPLDSPSSSKSSIKFAQNSNFVRTWSHQLIAPEMYKPPKKDNKNFVDLRTTATWRPSEVKQRDFATTHKAEYLNPSEIKSPEHAPAPSSEEVEAQRAENKVRYDAVENMCKTVKSTHGTVGSMLKSFNKKRTDDLSMHEFSTYLKRHKLDTYIHEDDVPKIFSFINPEHGGKVAVSDFLKRVEEVEFNRSEHNQEHQRIRDFIEFHHAQQQAATQSKDAANPSLAEVKASKSIPHEKEKLKKALGMKTYSVDLHPEEFNEILDTIHSQLHSQTPKSPARGVAPAAALPSPLHHGGGGAGGNSGGNSSSHDNNNLRPSSNPLTAETANRPLTSTVKSQEDAKIARFLHHSNLKLANVPFYEQRATELDRLKTRAAQVHMTLHAQDTIDKFTRLQDTVYRGPLTTVHSDDFLQTFDGFHVTRYDEDGVVYPQFTRKHLQDTQNSRSVSDLHGMSGLSTSPEAKKLAASQSLSALPAMSPAVSVMAARPSPLVEVESNPPLQHKPQAHPAHPSNATPRNPSSSRLSPLTHPAHHNNAHPHSNNNNNTNNNNTNNNNNRRVDLSARAAGRGIDEVLTPPGKSIGGGSSVSGSSLQSSNSLGQAVDTDFYVQVVGGEESMGRMRDASKVLRIEKVDDSTGFGVGGKKHIHDNVNNNTHIANEYKKQTVSQKLEEYILKGHGPNTTLHDDDMYASAHRKLYPPIIYKPSQPPTRDTISTVEIVYKTKEYRRNERYLRTKSNMDATLHRLEYERYHKELQEMHRTHKYMQDAIRYKTHIHIQDLQSFRSQPLQRMSKRQHIDLSDRMWGGTWGGHGIAASEGGGDAEPLTSTYRASFDSSILRESPVLKQPLTGSENIH